MSKTSSTVKNRYNAKVYDRVILAIPKGLKAEWQAKAEENGVQQIRSRRPIKGGFYLCKNIQTKPAKFVQYFTRKVLTYLHNYAII